MHSDRSSSRSHPGLQVRFGEMRQQLLNANSSEEEPEAKPVVKPFVKLSAADTEPKQLQCDRTADWARSENLTISLLHQQADPDEVFFPLPHQRTCELTEIFSAPRRRDRGKGSGEWTPSSAEAKSAKAKERVEEQASTSLELVGLDGEYAGEVLPLPVGFGVHSSKTVILGRSSACDVTLGRDDQISRRHLQIEPLDGKLVVRDLGSTCACWQLPLFRHS